MSIGRTLAALGLGCVLLAIVTGCGGGEPAHDKASLLDRVSARLTEVGAPSALVRCVRSRLSETLTEADAAFVYEDLQSSPEVSERGLRVYSLAAGPVRRQIRYQAVPYCARQLVRSRDLLSLSAYRDTLEAVSTRAFHSPGYLLAGL